MKTMSGYENAPATIMLATNCAICSRPLVDSKSVDAGMGPECRKRHGYNEVHDEDARAAANRIVHALALRRSDGSSIEGDWDALVAATALAGLGFRKLADVVAKRAATVRIVEDTGVCVNGYPVDHPQSGSAVLRVWSPYNELANDAWRQLRAPWDKEHKCRVVPAAKKRELFSLLVRFFADACAFGPKGAFRVEAGATPAA